MSLPSKKIICTGCNYETNELYQPILLRYQTKLGTAFETWKTIGWCYSCAKYSYIERINLEELQSELASKTNERISAIQSQNQLNRAFLSIFRNRSEKKWIQYEINKLEKKLENLAGLLEIAKNRKSKARCLTCWSEKTTPIEFDAESNIANNFRHECGGCLKIVEDPSGLRVNFCESTYILNEEGEFLAKE